MSPYLCVCLSTSLPVGPSTGISFYLHVDLTASLSVFLSVYLPLSFCLRVSLSVSLSPYVCLLSLHGPKRITSHGHSWRKQRDFLPAALTSAPPTRLQPRERSPEDEPDRLLHEQRIRNRGEKRWRRRRMPPLTFDLLLVVFTDTPTN